MPMDPLPDDGWQLATCSYNAWRPWMGVPCQTSIGAPKWWTGPTLQDVRSAAPWGLFDVADPAEFTKRYRHRLHRYAPRIVGQLEELRACYPAETLVLMCFERSRTDCHRGDLALWLEQRLGVEVPELTEAALWE